MDWDELLAAAEHHSVSPLLARHLAALPGGVPPRVLAALRERSDRNALRNIFLTRHLAELLQRLAAEDVRAMPIKGPVLAIAAYGDLALREFGDLDIVVHPRDFDRARSLLAAWGYVPRARLTSAGEYALRATDHHIPLVSPDRQVKVELHWSLGRGRLGRDDAWVWSNVRPVSILGMELPSLSWSALLVYLCAHGAGHGWGNLGWIRDVAGILLSNAEGTLRDAPRLAAAASARRRLALGVALAHELLGAPIPGDMERGIDRTMTDDRAVRRLLSEVHAMLRAEDAPTALEWLSFQCRTRDSVGDMAAYCAHVIAAPRVADVEWISLPHPLRWAYYVMRPARLVAKRLRRVPTPGSGLDS
ncbi:MAG TPA: nucleotidyltransferase family protein [Gemmatimonadaceae bacterium]|nr:nucleotidyltransferase family protein [Gemmatimonadaceae bacterium]